MVPSKQVEVKALGQKLAHIYDWAWPNETNGHVKLARMLGLKYPGNIYTWIAGNPTRRAEMVPARHIPTLSHIFGIPPEVLTGTPEVLIAWCKKKPYREPMDWLRLKSQGTIGTHLSLQRQMSAPSATTRGLEPDEESDSAVEMFDNGERARVVLDLRGTRWETVLREKSTLNLVMLVEDAQKIACLCPSDSKFAPHSELKTLLVESPADRDRWLKVTAPLGVQAVHAIIMERQLPAELQENFVRDQAQMKSADLDHLAFMLGAGQIGEFELMRFPYRVC